MLLCSLLFILNPPYTSYISALFSRPCDFQLQQFCHTYVSEYAPLRIPIYEAEKDNTATTMLNKIAMLKVFIVYPIVKETAHTLLISRIRK